MSRKTAQKVTRTARKIAALEREIMGLEGDHAREVLAALEELRTLTDATKQRHALDAMIWDELMALLEKLAAAKRLPYPPPGLIMSLLEEIIWLLTKLVFKAWLLQGLTLPQIDPRIASAVQASSQPLPPDSPPG